MNRPPRQSRILSRAALGSPEPGAEAHEKEELLATLLGVGAGDVELPPLADLAASLLALADGSRRKAILPLVSSTGEFALVRRGEHVLLSYYDSGPTPQLFVRDRAILLSRLLAVCAAMARRVAERSADLVAQRAAERVAERLGAAELCPDRASTPAPLARRGGAQIPPGNGAALAFGFRAVLSEVDRQDTTTRADVHALLFEGELWAFVHGRRVLLARGAVFPVVCRLLNAARTVVEAWESQRAINLRLKAGDFGVAVRLEQGPELTLTLGSTGGDSITLPASDVAQVVLPILRLGTDLSRTVISADRGQLRNLRLIALRDEARALRRIVRTKALRTSFVNRDPELLRVGSLPSVPRESGVAPVPTAPEPSSRLRLSRRWQAEIEGLDASATFLCGDRLVVATAQGQLAVSRDDGETLWMRKAPAQFSLMAGTTLACVNHEGEVALLDLADGEPYARARITPRSSGGMQGLWLGGRQGPPLVILTEGRDRLVALDVRTGALFWRFRSPGRGHFRCARAGRLLLVASGDSALDAIDTSTGEVAWRWSDPGRIVLAPVVYRDHVFAVSGSPATERGALLALDLYSGQLLFRRELETGPVASPIPTEQGVLTCVRELGETRLIAFDPSSGKLLFSASDPGLADGGSALVIDRQLIVNAPSGLVTALDLGSGKQSWQHRAADPLRDDMPRRLEPVLRGGALFVPSASVHVLRPNDGRVIGGPISEGVIPDFMRVDERGWMYLAEESGHLEAYAPAPSLRLVRDSG